MFQRLGNLVTRHSAVVLILWVAAGGALWTSAGRFEQVVVDGEFAYLPDEADSREAQELFDEAFGRKAVSERRNLDRDIVGSSVVVVVRRPNRSEGLRERDFEYIEDVLKPRIEAIAEAEGGLALADLVEEDEAEETASASNAAEGTGDGAEPERSIIARVRTPRDKSIGKLLVSEDHKAALVVVELTTEFLEIRNRPTITSIEELLEDLSSDVALRREWETGGLQLTISGLAVAGRDMRLAAEDSAKATERLTVVLVVVLLIAIYRAPLLAIVPLTTVALSVIVALGTLSLLAQYGMISLFTGVKVYVIVIMYGAGVDYCLFLLARYKEELDNGASTSESLANSVGRVGAALAASAGTTMCGIGMMYFADFGKFKQAGIAIPLSLFFVLVASVTFTPAVLRLCGRWAFWPHVSSERLPQRSGWISPTSLVSRILESDFVRNFWRRNAALLERRPATIWCTAFVCMLPFAAVGVVLYDHLSYGLLSELPDDDPSVVGAQAVKEHFPPGTTGPVTILIRNDAVPFAEYETNTETGETRLRIPPTRSRNGDEETDDETRSAAFVGRELVGELTANLEREREELGIADVRSLTAPYGLVPENAPEKAKGFRALVEAKTRRAREIRYYVSQADEYRGHVTRVDVVFDEDPFSRNSIAQFENFKSRLGALVPDDLARGATVHFVGATPSIRDLKVVTDHDQIKVDAIVSVAVFLILVVLLGRAAPGLVAMLVVAHFVWMSLVDAGFLGEGIGFGSPAFWLVDAVLLLIVVGLRGHAAAKSAYLMLSVLFSYFVTLGVTITVFYLFDPGGFAGLDWKVPMFLFTILVAVGQDYNIYLITRVEEEQERHGPVAGITVALARTGGIISSCGIIMAGTFSSLLAGSLVGMDQLGFALAFGVLLDTFVVRPILVPAYLILLHSGRFGVVGRFLGAHDYITGGVTPSLEIGRGNEK